MGPTSNRKHLPAPTHSDKLALRLRLTPLLGEVLWHATEGALRRDRFVGKIKFPMRLLRMLDGQTNHLPILIKLKEDMFIELLRMSRLPVAKLDVECLRVPEVSNFHRITP